MPWETLTMARMYSLGIVMAVTSLGQIRDTSTVISITSVVPPSVANPIAEVKLTNVSSKAILGYVLRAEFFDERGKSWTKLVRSVVAAVTAGRTQFAPRDTWTEQVQAPITVDGRPATQRVSIDYVLFADRSSAGPDTEKHSQRLRGIVAGAAFERARLRRVLRDRGAGDVIEEIKRR